MGKIHDNPEVTALLKDAITNYDTCFIVMTVFEFFSIASRIRIKNQDVAKILELSLAMDLICDRNIYPNTREHVKGIFTHVSPDTLTFCNTLFR